jgi:hypothetical protein
LPTLYAATHTRRGQAERSLGDVATTAVVRTICATMTPSSRASHPGELKGLEPRSDLGPFWYWYTRRRKMNQRALDMRATARIVNAETRLPPLPCAAADVDKEGGGRIVVVVLEQRTIGGGGIGRLRFSRRRIKMVRRVEGESGSGWRPII